MLKRDGD